MTPPTAPTSFMVTTPIYYVNDKPHIGHCYTSVACDVLARFKRLDGYQVHFVTGTDEHGQKIHKAAEAAGMAPQDFTDVVAQRFVDMAQTFGISHDDFLRTSEPRHARAAQALWARLQERGAIYEGHYAGWYAVRDEAFYAESELEENAEGQKVAPGGAAVEWVEEPSFFFRLSAWQEPLLEHYRQHPEFLGPDSRRNEVVRFVEGGLRDLSISRTSFTWGIPVTGSEGHVMYVWLDALTNYLTSLGYPDEDTQAFQAFWPADIHVVGKDIVRFHAVYWPALLMAAGLEVPRRIYAHGWWTHEGQKISKSLGNIIDGSDLVARYGLDPVRYFLLRAIPFGQDGDFSHTAMVQRLNTDLANDWGNLMQRVLSLLAKNCDGQIPAPGALDSQDAELLAQARGVLEDMRAHIDRQSLSLALEALWRVVAAANRYVHTEAPWRLWASDPARAHTILHTLVSTLRMVALASLPFMPGTAGRALDALGVPVRERTYAHYETAPTPGTRLPAPEPLFPRVAS